MAISNKGKKSNVHGKLNALGGKGKKGEAPSKRNVLGNVEPLNFREEALDKKAMKSTKRTVRPVALDTNKTRRKPVKPTLKGNL